jgi:hypothetical protein
MNVRTMQQATYYFYRSNDGDGIMVDSLIKPVVFRFCLVFSCPGQCRSALIDGGKHIVGAEFMGRNHIERNDAFRSIVKPIAQIH